MPTGALAQFSVLHSFAGSATDGANPVGSLILSGSTLYGMTSGGGADNYGTIFKINTDGNGFQLLHTFIGSDGNSQNTWPGYFQPHGSLTLSGSTLYGMAYGGGTSNYGTVFKVNTDGSGFQLLHTFTASSSDGANPAGSLTLSDSTLYGMTSGGGANGRGTIFQIDTNGSGFQLLYSFGSNDAAYPLGSLTFSGSTLYGMTSGDLAFLSGTVFRINTDGSGFQLLTDFNGTSPDIISPFGSLTLSGSTLYGMTSLGGGSDSWGSIFRINTNGTGYSLLYSWLNNQNIVQPIAADSLALSGSTLYGMTLQGGDEATGSIFQINNDGSGYQTLYSFTGYSEGGGPYGSLTLSGSNTLRDDLWGRHKWPRHCLLLHPCLSLKPGCPSPRRIRPIDSRRSARSASWIPQEGYHTRWDDLLITCFFKDL